MPILVVGNPLKTLKDLTGDKDLKYKYPDDMKLKPDSDLHKTIATKIYEMTQTSRQYMSQSYPSWRRMDKTLMAFKDLTQKEKDIKKKDPTKPTAIVVPISFALRQTILTYFVSRFLSPPIFRYDGFEGGDTLTAAKLEMLVDLHCFQSKVGLNLLSMWQDSIGYGIGVSIPHWMRKFGKGTAKNPFGGPHLMWEGNALSHVSPYDFLPDPMVDVNHPQDAEFIGYVEHTNMSSLLAREQSEPNKWFNVRYLWNLMGGNTENSEALTFEKRPSGAPGGVTPVDVVHKSVSIIPSLWGLGTGQYPEKWLFSVAANSIVIKAEPLGLFYDEHPIAVCAPVFDNYSMTPISLLERVQGLQTFADWLVNAHILNVRKGLGINIVYDPMAINGIDLRSDNAVKLIRLRPTHWGRGDVSKYIQQLKVDDVTRQNIPDTSAVFDLMQRGVGVSDGPQGIVTGGERTSATEASNTFGASMSRIQMSAKIISEQAHQDIARHFAYNIQQLMSKPQRLKILGDQTLKLQAEYGSGSPEGNLKSTVADPEDFVDFDFNVISSDASVPGEEDRRGWEQLVSPLLANPQNGTALGLDMKRIFLHLARQLGARNAADFLLNPPSVRVVPDSQIREGAEAGNLVPIEPTGTPTDAFDGFEGV